MKIIFVKRYSNIYKDEYDVLFKVVKDGFEGMNPQDVLEYKSLTAGEIGNLTKLIDEDEEIDGLKELLEEAFWEDPEAAAKALNIPVYAEMPWEVYFPDEE